MFTSELKVGMKVVPVIKTIDGPLSKSKQWKEAREADQRFLFIIKLDEKPGKKPVIILAKDRNAKTGEQFATIDLRAYPWVGWRCRTSPGLTKGLKARAKEQAKAKAKKAPAKKAPAKKAPAKKVKPAPKKTAVKKAVATKAVVTAALPDDLPPIETVFPG